MGRPFFILTLATAAFGRQAPDPQPDKRIFGVLPNYRTAN